MGSFAAMAGGWGKLGPRSAAQIYELQGWLMARLPEEDACMIAAWVATGKEKSKWWEFGVGTGGAKEHCTKKGLPEVSLAEALDDLAALGMPEVTEAITRWGQRKEHEFKEMIDEQAQEDAAAAIDDATDAAKEAAKSVGAGLGIGAGALVIIIGLVLFSRL